MTEADSLFGVAHTNRISRVYAIQRDDALKFLQVRCGLILSACGIAACLVSSRV